MNDLVPITEKDGKPAVDARFLHEKLEVGRDFSNWIKDRIDEYEFVEGKDFEKVEHLSSPNLVSSKARPQVMIDYIFFISAANMLIAGEHKPLGREFLRYLGKVGEAWDTPELVMERAKQAERLTGSRRPMLESVKTTLELERIAVEKGEHRTDLVLRQFILENFRITGMAKDKISIKKAYELYCTYAEQPLTVKDFETNVCFSYPEVCSWGGNLTGLKKITRKQD
jgi:phage anti-repressor protein